MISTNKKTKILTKISFFLFITALIFFINQVIKSVADGCFSIFCIKHTVNFGAAFNFLSCFSWAPIFLIIFAFAVLFVTAFFYFRTNKKIQIALTFLFAGTLTNLIDRLLHGYVIDFLTFSFRSPNFNVADISNILGAVLLVIFLMKKS